ncbi:hypothetical protein ACFV3R_18570 [Streptomyces sp. NPDC059740]|uniref:hypothetical protein n=1 Tax=Streptomyces sp. NPDC059740 TaxID=3346926 RepID=UPI003656B5DE
MHTVLTGHRLRRTGAGLGLALALAAGGVLGTGGAAFAGTATEASLSFSGDAGDYISGGGSYSYATASNDRLNVSGSTDHSHVNVSVDGANGDWWYLDLAAPAGQELQAGTYTGATRYPFNESAEPGLSLDGNGRGCNTLTGSFTITDIAFAPDGSVQDLDATYEQHCEGGSAALRGEVHVASPEPPPALDLGLGVAVDGTASALNGKASVHGTVTCTKPVDVTVSGKVTQVKKHVLIRGDFTGSVNCTPGAPVSWTAQADPTGTTPFQRGDVQVDATASATDPDYGSASSVDQTAVVHLVKG